MKNVLWILSFLFVAHFSLAHANKALSYDANSNVTKYVTPHAGEISCFYDSVNRLTGISYPDGGTIKYAYDCNDNLIETRDQQGKTLYSYDSLNRLVQAQLPKDVSLRYEYDASDRIVKITYPDKEEVKYSYDERGRLFQVCDHTGITEYEYDDATNLVIREHLANGIITEFGYDGLSRISSVSHKRAGDFLIVLYRFIYDANNHCILLEEVTDEGTKSTHYGYDDLNRLVTTTCSDGTFEKYVYDAAGNRLKKETYLETIHYEYDHNNRLIRSGDTVCQYDASGNLVKKISSGKQISLSYDSSGKLVLWKDEHNEVAFAYDGEGRRISKTVNGKVTFFINDPNTFLSRVLLEKDETGATKKRYVYGLSRLFEEGSNRRLFFLYEHPGKSVSVLTDQNQNILERVSVGSSQAID